MHDLFENKKRISIIIPTLNEEKLIERSLSQFTKELKETYNIEVIVSDGGSKDSTIEISKKYADRLILHTEKFPQNISQGRNAGAKYSQRDVLIFLNADTCIKDTDYFFELHILEDELTKDVSLLVVEKEEKNEIPEASQLWENQISDLKHVIGSV